MFAWTYIRSKISIFNYQLPKYNLHLDIQLIYIYIRSKKDIPFKKKKKKPYNLMSNNSRQKFRRI